LGATLLRALARQIGWTLGTRPARRALSFVMGSSSGHRLDLGAGRAVELAFDRVRLVARPAASSPTAQEIATEHGALVWRDVQFRWREEPAGDSTRRAWVAWITPGAWSLRPPLRGERLRPLGGVGRREVRRLLMEARVPAADRAAYPVVARGGAALWVPGVCRAAADVPPPGSPAVRIEAVGPG
jgi:tRNA(Ile)-lysidine synthetase-like protein